MTTETVRPSQLVGMRVTFIQNQYAREHDHPILHGRVVDVLFTSFAEGGMIEDRTKIIVLLDNGRLKEAFVNQLEAELQN